MMNHFYFVKKVIFFGQASSIFDFVERFALINFNYSSFIIVIIVIKSIIRREILGKKYRKRVFRLFKFSFVYFGFRRMFCIKLNAFVLSILLYNPSFIIIY